MFELFKIMKNPFKTTWLRRTITKLKAKITLAERKLSDESLDEFISYAEKKWAEFEAKAKGFELLKDTTNRVIEQTEQIKGKIEEIHFMKDHPRVREKVRMKEIASFRKEIEEKLVRTRKIIIELNKAYKLYK